MKLNGCYQNRDLCISQPSRDTEMYNEDESGEEYIKMGSFKKSIRPKLLTNHDGPPL